MSLYNEYFYSKQVSHTLSVPQTLAQMLRFEEALATAQAAQGIIPEASAVMIGHCCKVEYVDIDRLKAEIKLGGNAAIPLVKQLTRIVKNQDVEASKYVHFGATSQDVIDTALTLQIQQFVAWLEVELTSLERILEALTRRHRNTLMIGRTLLQHAKPITFGLKTAKWLATLRQLRNQLLATKKSVLVLTLGGAVGSGNKSISKAVQKSMAEALGLLPPAGVQGNFTAFACTLGPLCGYLGKIGREVSLLMQTEVAEVYEGAADGKGGSSTMPHKRNPVTCTALVANATRIPHLVATMLSAMPQEYERSAGLWHAEWETLNQIMGLTAGSVERCVELLQSLEVDEGRMLANLELTNGLIYAENVSLALAAKMGKSNAHELIEKACHSAISQRKHLKEILTDMNLGLENLEALFDPQTSIGNNLEMIDEILSND